MSANFTPSLDGYTGQQPFKFWCQKVLPLVYDESLSYYELLCKVVNYLNNAIKDVATVEDNVQALAEAFNALQDYVNDYFDSLDVTDAVEENVKRDFDEFTQSEEFRNIIDTFIDGYVNAYLIDNVADEVDRAVGEQISGTVAEQIGGTVSEQLPSVVTPVIAPTVTNWLAENVTPVGSAVTVDSSLTIAGSAADAKATGDGLNTINNAITYDQNHSFYQYKDGVTLRENGYYTTTNPNTLNPLSAYTSLTATVNGESKATVSGAMQSGSGLAAVMFLTAEYTLIKAMYSEGTVAENAIVDIPFGTAYIRVCNRTSYGITPKIELYKSQLEETVNNKMDSGLQDIYEFVDTTLTRGYWTTNGTFHDSDIYSSLTLTVKQGSRYKADAFVGTNTSLALAVYLDENNNLVGYQNRSEGTAISYKTESLIVPANTTTICITSLSSKMKPAIYESKRITLTPTSVYNAIKYSNYLKLYGKTIANFGDSIFGNKRPPYDISTGIAEITGATVYNLGFGGCRMASRDNPNWNAFSMYMLATSIANCDFTVQDAVDTESITGMGYFAETLALLKTIDFTKVDIITIAYGTNDFTGGNAIDNADNPLDTSTFAGALRYSIQTLLTAYPNILIFVCTPTWRFWMNADNQFIYDSDTHKIDGRLLTDFVEKAITVAEEYHIPSIDNYYKLGINKYNRSKWFPATDGTHHNKDGGRLIARHMVNEMF